MIMLESIDSWLVNDEVMPTLSSLQKMVGILKIVMPQLSEVEPLLILNLHQLQVYTLQFKEMLLITILEIYFHLAYLICLKTKGIVQIQFILIMAPFIIELIYIKF